MVWACANCKRTLPTEKYPRSDQLPTCVCNPPFAIWFLVNSVSPEGVMLLMPAEQMAWYDGPRLVT